MLRAVQRIEHMLALLGTKLARLRSITARSLCAIATHQPTATLIDRTTVEPQNTACLTEWHALGTLLERQLHGMLPLLERSSTDKTFFEYPGNHSRYPDRGSAWQPIAEHWAPDSHQLPGQISRQIDHECI